MKFYFGYIVLISIALLSAHGAEECSTDKYARCEACSEGGGLQFAHGMPRYNSAGASVSNNMGAYKWFDCDNQGECEFVDIDFGGSSDNEESVNNWMEGVAVVGIAGALMFVLTLFFAFSLCLCRCCCSCCCHISWLACGGASPTRKRCCLGYTTKGHNEFGYGMGQKLLAVGCVLLFIILCLAFIGVGITKGSQGMTSGMKKASTSPSGLVSMLQGVETPIVGFVQDATSDTFVTFLNSTNTTIQGSTDLAVIHTQLGVIITKIDNFPSITGILSLITQFESGTNTIKSGVTNLKTAINGIQTYQNSVSAKVDAAIATVDGLSAALGDVKYAVPRLRANVTTLDGAVTALKAGITSLQTDLTSYSNNKPVDADVDPLISASNNDALPALLNTGNTNIYGPSATARSNRNTLGTNMATLKSKLDNLPNLATTAATMTAFNTKIDEIVDGKYIGKLDGAATDTKNALDRIPTAASINATIQDLFQTARALDISPIKNALNSVNASVAGLPSFDLLTAQLNKISDVATIFSHLDLLTDELRGLNTTVLELPSEFDSITSLSADLNSTLQPALQQVETGKVSIADAKSQVQSLNVSEYTGDIDSLNTKVDDSIGKVDIGVLMTQLQSVDTNKNVDFSAINQAKTFESTIKTNKIDSQLITDLQNFETAKATAISLLDEFITRFAVFRYGFCIGSSNAPCQADAPVGDQYHCTGTCQSEGLRRCRDNQGTSCTSDSDCTAGGDVCLITNDRVNALVGGVTAMKNAPDTSAASTSVTDVSGTTTINTAALLSTLTTAENSIDSVDVNSRKADLTSVKSSLTAFDVSSTNSAFDDLETQLNAVDYSDYRSQLQPFEQQVEDARGAQRKNAVDAKEFLGSLVQLLNRDLHGYFDSLSKPTLRQVTASGGLAGLLDHVAGVMDAMVNSVGNSTLFNITTSLKKDLVDPNERINDFFSLSNLERGGSAYVLGLVGDRDKMVMLGDPSAGRIFEDKNGNDYPNDKLCLTQACIDASIEYYNTQPISEWSDVPISMSREQLQNMLYILPGLLILWALWALTCPLCCCRRKPKWQKVPASCLTGWTLCLAPFVFLFAGLLFVLVVGMSDGCAGGVNVGQQYVKGSEPKLCKDLGGDFLASGNCKYETSSDFNVTLNLDIPGLYENVVGSCERVDAIAPLWAELRRSIGTVPRDEADKFLNTSTSDIKLRDPMRTVVLDAATSIGDKAAVLVGGLGSALSCQKLNRGVVRIMEGFCCDIGDGVYWSIASWYLLAWTMLFCGCTGGLLGRKRFPRNIWGREYEKELAAAAAVQLDEQDAQGNEAYVDWDNQQGNTGVEMAPTAPVVDYGADWNTQQGNTGVEMAPTAPVVDYGGAYSNSKVQPADF